MFDEDAETPLIRPKDAPRSLDQSERERRFGVLPWKLSGSPPGTVWVDPKWEAENLTTIRIPWQGMTSSATGEGRVIRVHKLAAKPIADLFERWRTDGYLPLVQTFNGAYVPRMKRGHESSTLTKDLSNHSWGTAFDINAPWNRFGARPASVGKPGSVALLVQAAADLGFAWGGYFSKPDGQHFEFVGKVTSPPPLAARTSGK